MGLQACGAVERAPDFALHGPLFEAQEDHLAQVGQRLVQRHADDALDVERLLEVLIEQRLIGGLLENARLAGRHLAQHGGEDGLLLHGDGGDAHRHVEIFQRNVAVAFAERAFGLQQFSIDKTFNHDFSVGGNLKIHRLGAGYAHCASSKAASHSHLVFVDAQLLRPGERDHGRAADDDRTGHRLAHLLILKPVDVAAGAAQARGHAHAKAVVSFEACAIGAHVAHAGFGIFRHAQRGRQIRRSVKAGRGDGCGQDRQAGPLKLVAGDDDFLTGSVFNEHRRNRLVDRLHPDFAEVLNGYAHAYGVDLVGGGKRAHHDGDVVFLAAGAHHIGEQESATCFLRKIADELPAHQGMKLRVLADRAINTDQKPFFLQPGQMLLKIRRRAGCHWVRALS